MYYGLDENGNIVQSNDSSVLPDEYEGLVPSDANELPPQVGQEVDEVSTISNFSTVSSGSGFGLYDNLDYNELSSTISEAIANVPSYDIYPSTAGVEVMKDVLYGVDRSVGYVILSGPSSGDVSLYYSEHYDSSGNTITLSSPVTHCRYYTVRDYNTTHYYYSVSSEGSQTFTLSNDLAYTNLVDGYPDVYNPIKQDFGFAIVVAILLILVIIFLVCRKGGK